MWNCCHLSTLSVHHTTMSCHFVQSNTCWVHACLAVTRHQHCVCTCMSVVFMHLYMCLCACKINCCRQGTQQSFKALGESVEMTLSGVGGGVGEEGETAGTRKRIIFFLHTYTEIVNHVLLFFFLSLVITIIQLIILSLWPFKLEFSVLAFSSEQSMVLTLQTEHGQIFIPSSTCLGQICQIPKAQDTYIQTKKTQASNMQQLLCTRLKMHMLHIILQKKNKTDKRLWTLSIRLDKWCKRQADSTFGRKWWHSFPSILECCRNHLYWNHVSGFKPVLNSRT